MEIIAQFIIIHNFTKMFTDCIAVDYLVNEWFICQVIFHNWHQKINEESIAFKQKISQLEFIYNLKNLGHL